MKTIFNILLFCLVLLTACSTAPVKDARVETVLLSSIKNNSSSVSFTSDETGRPVISWCETDSKGKKLFFLSYLNEQGSSFIKPVNIPVEQNTNLHEEGMPKIAVRSDGSILAVYETAAPTKENKFAGFIRYIQSFDNGRTWTNPLYLHADTTAGKGHSFASITRLSDGEIGACWLDVSYGNKKGGRSVKFSKTNGHSGFGAEIIVDSFACQCCRTAISCDAGGNIGIMFRDVLMDSIRDMSVCSSSNNGKTFGKPVAFTNDGWVINGCPHNGPSIIKDGERSYAAWFTGGNHSGLYYAEMNGNNEMVERKTISNNGRNIQLCMLPDKTRFVAYNENVKLADSFYSKIAVNKIEAGKMWTMDISETRAKAGYPVLHPAGNSAVAVAWEENNKLYYRIVDKEAINKAAVNYAQVLPGQQLPLAAVKLASKKDLVCGMPVTAGVKDTAHYKGNIYGFCAKECKDEFVKEPQQYLTAK